MFKSPNAFGDVQHYLALFHTRWSPRALSVYKVYNLQ